MTNIKENKFAIIVDLEEGAKLVKIEEIEDLEGKKIYELDTKVGEEMTLNELDNEMMADLEIRSTFDSIGSDFVLNDESISFYINETNDSLNVLFEIIDKEKGQDTLVRITDMYIV